MNSDARVLMTLTNQTDHLAVFRETESSGKNPEQSKYDVHSLTVNLKPLFLFALVLSYIAPGI